MIFLSFFSYDVRSFFVTLSTSVRAVGASCKVQTSSKSIVHPISQSTAAQRQLRKCVRFEDRFQIVGGEEEIAPGDHVKSYLLKNRIFLRVETVLRSHDERSSPHDGECCRMRCGHSSCHRLGSGAADRVCKAKAHSPTAVSARGERV